MIKVIYEGQKIYVKMRPQNRPILYLILGLSYEAVAKTTVINKDLCSKKAISFAENKSIGQRHNESGITKATSTLMSIMLYRITNKVTWSIASLYVPPNEYQPLLRCYKQNYHTVAGNFHVTLLRRQFFNT